jgi:hypothetical protein
MESGAHRLVAVEPEEIHGRARRPLRFGLVATTDAAYAEMEDFLAPSRGRSKTAPICSTRCTAPATPRAGTVDLILFEQGIAAPPGTYTFFRA